MLHAVQGVTQPPLKPEVPPATFGFVENAEIINSRAAMVRVSQSAPSKPEHCGAGLHSDERIGNVVHADVRAAKCSWPAAPCMLLTECIYAAQLGFFGILLVEALAGKGVFELVGINVGNGLGFEF